MRALTTIGIQETTDARINNIKTKHKAKTKEQVIIALLNVIRYYKLQQELKGELGKIK